jgi:hypothetical protein
VARPATAEWRGNVRLSAEKLALIAIVTRWFAFSGEHLQGGCVHVGSFSAQFFRDFLFKAIQPGKQPKSLRAESAHGADG